MRQGSERRTREPPAGSRPRLIIPTASAYYQEARRHPHAPPDSVRTPFLSVLALGAVALLPLGAQQPATRPAAASTFEFTIASMMRGPEVYGRAPDSVRWSPDGKYVYFSWLPPGTDWRERLQPYRVRAAAGARPERLTRAQADTVAPLLAAGSETPDHRWKVSSWQGDLYLADLRGGSVRRLTATYDEERAPVFAADARRVFFVRGDNVFSMDVDGGLIRQLTDVRTGTPPREDSVRAGQRGFLEREERALLEAVRDQVRADSIRRAEQRARDSLRSKPVYLKRGERISELSVSPSGRALLVVTDTDADSARRTGVPQFVTRTGYTEELRVRTKVGDAQGTGRVGIVRLPDGEVKWLKLQADSTRVGTEVQVFGWNETGTAALLAATSPDFTTRTLYAVGDTGALTSLHVERDSAWVGSKSYENTACIECAGWLPGGSRLWYVSEASGYAHLYAVNRDGSDRRQLTSGNWEIIDVSVSRDGRTFYLHSSEGSPFELHFWRMPVAGGTRERLTTTAGANFAVPSPDGRRMAVVHSEANRPPELYVGELKAGAPLAQLTTSPTAEWLSHPWIKPAIVQIPASDGRMVPARIYRPEDVGARPNGAAAIFVHGAGYLHNVHNYWSTYSREYMFNHYLASKGYVVLDVDYRGSAGYGRDWRTAIYRHMGGRDLEDHVDASRWLEKEMGIPGDRVGIYGGSYGGFITLMALFNAHERFGAGAALRSVTDWAHYNHGYTARILNEPHEDSVAYRRSSPIYFAQNLRDPLLIAHGMVDTNVHFQDVVRLAQRLIELGKTRWEMAVYPVENHGFTRPSSWTDEYRRIFELFEANLHPRTTMGAGSSGGTR